MTNEVYGTHVSDYPVSIRLSHGTGQRFADFEPLLESGARWTWPFDMNGCNIVSMKQKKVVVAVPYVCGNCRLESRGSANEPVDAYSGITYYCRHVLLQS
jgi:hypothetical protein